MIHRMDMEPIYAFIVSHITDAELLSVTPKERLLELLLLQFDAFDAHDSALCGVENAGWRSYFKQLYQHPCCWKTSLQNLKDNMKWLLEKASINTHGPVGTVYVCALSGVYIGALKTWITFSPFPQEKAGSDLADLPHHQLSAFLDEQLTRLGF